jgi:hypothetical protein
MGASIFFTAAMILVGQRGYVAMVRGIPGL